MRSVAAAVALAALAACESGGGKTAQPAALGTDASSATATRRLRVLFFQEEGADVGWYHTSNPLAEQALRAYGAAHDWETTTAKASTGTFTPDGLAPFDVVVYLLSSGTVLDASERAALQGFMRGGGGYAGVHSAGFTDPDWQWYIGLVGDRFATESDKFYEADVVVEKPEDPLLSFLPRRWHRTDQWYKFLARPEDNASLEILLSLDEASLAPEYPAAAKTGYHPIAWRQTSYEGARSFYTGMGHTDDSYTEALFVRFIANGVEWAGDASRRTRP